MIENGKVVIHAVHERDIKGMWKKLKLKKIENCFVCGKDVTHENCGAFAPLKIKGIKTVGVICEKLHCLSQLNYKKQELESDEK